MFLVFRLINCALLDFYYFGWTIMLCCECCHLVPIHRKMEQLDVFVGGLSVLLDGIHLVYCFLKDRTMGKAHLPSCPNFSEDGDHWPSPRISIFNN